tara:strand:+ start:10003 stop:10521 length:519 start_codon:yes stop_codon:yes gene_type:complete
MKASKGQVWVETVMYTLIALILIGTVLAFITPKIQEIQDKAIIEQSIEMLQNIDKIISSVLLGGPGNKRIVDIGIKKGNLIINSEEDKIVFELESPYDYSQEGETINSGGITILTENIGSSNKITLTSNYSKYDLTYESKNDSKSITQAPLPYKLSIENKGGSTTVIDFTLS